MMYDPERHHRRSVRWELADYTGEGWFFVTICTHGRRNVLSRIEDSEVILTDIGRVVEECWLALPDRLQYVDLGRHVIMPNHLHGTLAILHSSKNPHIVPPNNRVGASRDGQIEARPLGDLQDNRMCPPGSLGAIMRSFKSECTRRIRQAHGDPAFELWQRSFHERVVGGPKSLKAICDYIRANPADWHRDPDNPDARHR